MVAFNDDFMHRGAALWPQISDKLHRIPQGAITEASQLSLRRSLGMAPSEKIFLLPSGLRPVKDPLFLLNCISEWHEEDPRIRLVIAGSSYAPEFAGIVERRCASRPGTHYIGPLPQPDLHAAMLEATAVLNTSLSECSPNAVLEAMDLSCPVIVRDIPGNTCLCAGHATVHPPRPGGRRDGGARRPRPGDRPPGRHLDGGDDRPDRGSGPSRASRVRLVAVDQSRRRRPGQS